MPQGYFWMNNLYPATVYKEGGRWYCDAWTIHKPDGTRLLTSGVSMIDAVAEAQSYIAKFHYEWLKQITPGSENLTDDEFRMFANYNMEYGQMPAVPTIKLFLAQHKRQCRNTTANF